MTPDRALDNSLHLSRMAFELVLREPCHSHRSRPEQPCWDVLGHHAACGGRISTALRKAKPLGPPPLDPPLPRPRPFTIGRAGRAA